MSSKPLHLGIDLGTTNSSAAVFDGEVMTLIRNSQGSPLTPSVVRIDARANVTVGVRARRFLESDPENTRAEFKRLMGTSQPIPFPASKGSRRPEELSAEVLKGLRQDVRDQLGFAPETAVVCVPALFELPQSSATSEAARLAGFRRVELLQEPVASALAAGWRHDGDAGKWLVFDLGAGTFDASLLETRDGMLRVIGHDGDNFLGGRDIDWAIVDWALGRIAADRGIMITRAEPSRAAGVRKVKLAAEEAKIELSRAAEAPLVVPGAFDSNGEAIDVDLMLARGDLDLICGPFFDRAVSICLRLLSAHGAKGADLSRVVLVGGPTAMPLLRQKVADGIGAEIAEGIDPMTIVAQGAAIYAASTGLDARPESPVERKGRPIVLQYPAISGDLKPFVVGKVTDAAGTQSPAPERIRLARADGAWAGPFVDVAPDGAFVLSAELVARKTNVFAIEAATKDGAPVPVHPSSITIVQGLTITDPPLSRTVGVALADDEVRVFFERGDPLPARRTVTFHTVEGVASGCSESLLTIPFVQGEYAHAHLCRLVGSLVIPGNAVSSSLPVGSAIEVTMEVDRGGKISARAFVPAVDQVFEEVAHLAIPSADPKELEASLAVLAKRADQLMAEARRHGNEDASRRCAEAKRALEAVGPDLDAARGGDADAAQKARRALLDADALLEDVEAEKRWPELEELARWRLTWAMEQVEAFGTPTEKRMLQETAEAIERARKFREALELERQVRLATRLGNASYFRAPDSWERMFDNACADVSRASDLPRAQKLVRDGEKARAKKDRNALRDIVRELWDVLPPDARDKQLGFDSGVR